MKTTGRILGSLGLLILISALFTYFAVTGSMDWYVWIKLAAGTLFLAIYLATNREDLGKVAGGKGTFYTATSGIALAVLLAALVGINYIGAKKNHEWDLTQNHIFTLSDQTQNILKGLKKKVTVEAFYRPDEPEYQKLNDLLHRYRAYTSNLSFHFVDIYRHPEAVKQENITQSGPRIIVKSGSKESRAKAPTEEDLTNAIAQVVGGGEKEICFLRGHGEKLLTDDTANGLKTWNDQIKSEGYATKEVELADQKGVPGDCELLVIPGPVAKLLAGEVSEVKSYAAKGGRVMALLDPGIESGLEPLLASWGVLAGDNTVVDPQSQYPTFAIAQEYAHHPITNPRTSIFPQASVYPLSRQVAKAATVPPGYTVVELAKTGAAAWAEKGSIEPGSTLSFDASRGDAQGPVSLAVAVTHGAGKDESRAVVFGTSQFVTNNAIGLLGNRDIALNAIDWLAHEEQKISIRPRARASSHLFLSAAQSHAITFFSFDLLPLALLALGIGVWQTRRAK